MTSCFTKSSQAIKQYEKYDIFVTTKQYNDFGLLELRLFSTVCVLSELQNLPEIL